MTLVPIVTPALAAQSPADSAKHESSPTQLWGSLGLGLGSASDGVIAGRAAASLAVNSVLMVTVSATSVTGFERGANSNNILAGLKTPDPNQFVFLSAGFASASCGNSCNGRTGLAIDGGTHLGGGHVGVGLVGFVVRAPGRTNAAGVVLSLDFGWFVHYGTSRLRMFSPPPITMNANSANIRPLREQDRDAWGTLWDGYNAFYGRRGDTALPEEVTRTTWERFFDPNEPVHALVAERDGKIVGLAHFLFHRSTTAIAQTCYLQDLFVTADARGTGVGRALIEAVSQRAADEGSSRVYWQTHESNPAARALYDRVAEYSGFLVYKRVLG